MSVHSETYDASMIEFEVKNFIIFLRNHLDAKVDIPIDIIFRLLPINPVSTAIKQRIILRKKISVSGKTLLVTAPPIDNHKFTAMFNDTVGGLGLINVTIEPRIEATYTLSAQQIRIEFSGDGVPVWFAFLGSHTVLGQDQLLTAIEMEGFDQVRYYFQDQDNPNEQIELTVASSRNRLLLLESADAGSTETLKLSTPKHVGRMLTLLSSDARCAGGVGTCTDEDTGDTWVVRRNSLNGYCTVAVSTASPIGNDISTHFSCAEAKEWIKFNSTGDPADTSRCYDPSLPGPDQ